MNESATLWEEADEPVLKFVQTFPFKFDLELDRRGPTEELPSLTGEEFDSSLRRLEDFGLISWRSRSETIGYFRYSGLRLAADGLRVLGLWPPREEALLASAVVQLLRALAEDSDSEVESKKLKRAAGVVARFTGDVIFDVAKSELKSLGEGSV